MPLPAGFPQAPTRPPASQAFVTPQGTVSGSWLAYFDALATYQAALRKHLDTL